MGKLDGTKVFVSDQVTYYSSRINMKKYEDFIARHGSASTANIREADIVLVDTCGFNEEMEEKSVARS